MKLFDQIKAGRWVQKLKGSRSLPTEAVEEAKSQLVRMGPGAIPTVLECLSHGDARGPALDVLGRLLSDETLDFYVEALTSPNPTIVSGVSKVLASSSGYDLFRILGLLADPSLNKSVLEGILMERVEDVPPRHYMSMIPELGKEGRAVVFRLLERVADDTVVPDAIKLLDDEDWWVRLYMAKLLGEHADDDGIKALARLLHDSHKGVRLEAVEGLHKLEARAAIPSLVKVLRDPDLKVQTAAIDTLIDFNDVSAVHHLLDVLKDESEYARRAAVEVLNAVATTDAIQDLVRALRDEDWWVRVRAADALGTLGGEKVVEGVVGLLQDEDDFVRRYAVEILNAVPSQRAVEPLVRSLHDRDWWVRERSIDALGKTGDPRAVEPLLDLLNEDPGIAPLCINALARIGDPRAVNRLCHLATSTQEEVKRAATDALKTFSRMELPPEDRDQIQEVLGRRDQERLPEGGRTTRPTTSSPPTARPTLPPEPMPMAVSPASSRPDGGQPPAGATRRPEGAGEDAGGAPNFTRISRGTVLLDRFRVIRQVGKGGFGAIYLVEDTAVREELILKILNPQLSGDETALRRFVQELKLTRAITHQNVIRIYDLLDLKGAHAVSMEYFPSKDLGKILRTENVVEPLRALRIAAQTCEGLAAAHKEGVIHRDMKPANILVGEQDAIKIVDFGLAAAEQQIGSRLTRSGLLIGTPEYMAPEQISGGEVDHRSDIYSMGIILYEMLSGRKPFTADTPVKILFQHLEGEAEPLGKLVPGLPLDLEYLVTCSMARDPADRPRTAEDLREMMQRVQSDLEKAA